MNYHNIYQVKNQILKLIISLISGICMGLTTAPISAFPLAWIALAPLWILIFSSSQKAKGTINYYLLPIIYALIWGIGYHGVALFWITGIHPMTWMGVPWLASLGIAIFAWTFITLWGAALVTTWTICQLWINQTNISPLLRVLIATALWCGLENLWSLSPLWWSSISYTQSPHNLAILHLSQLSGFNTVTAAIIAINGLIAEAWLYSKNINHKYLYLPYLSIATALFLSLHLLGFIIYNQPLLDAQDQSLKIGIIQGNIPNEIKSYSGGLQKAIAGYTSGYKTLADMGVDAILTPETALPFQLEELQRGDFYNAILNKGIIAWVGAFGAQGNSYTNSLYTITGKGEIFNRYDKLKLVPLGEYIPFEEVVGKLINRLSPLDAHLIAGAPNQIVETPFGRAIVGICYESAFSEHFRRQAEAGGQFILTASNNAHYTTSMPAQHHAQDVIRAIETDRWAVRATNTGYSGIVNPHGKTIWISGINTYEIHADTIYRRQTKTLYVKWGDWLTSALLIGAGIIWGWQQYINIAKPSRQ